MRIAVTLMLTLMVLQVQPKSFVCDFFIDEVNSFRYTCNLQRGDLSETDGFEIDTRNHLSDKADDDLKTFNVINSNFVSVPIEILEKFTQLIVLRVTKSQVQFIEKPFVSCENLDTIDFSENRIKNVPKIFDECKNLLYVYLSSNQIETIDPFVFSMQIFVVKLDNNKMQAVSGELFKDCHNLNLLYLDENNIEELPEEIFKSNENLEYLDLSDNPFKVLPENIFIDLKKLKSLYMVRNALQNPSLNILKNLSALKNLALYSNEVTGLDESVFQGLEALIKLDISFNQISYIHPNCFSALVNLEELILYYNKITIIDARHFATLVKLNILELSNNLISEIQSNSFDFNSKLTDLYLKSNLIKKLPGDIFTNLHNVVKLEMYNNPFEFPNDISTSFKGLFNLVKLKLTYANITEIGENTLTDLVELNEMYLGFNQITFVHPKSFLNLKKMIVLDLSYNKIATFDSNLFSSMKKLYYLFVHYNEIQDFPIGAFVGLEELDYLIIYGNQAKILRKNSFGVLPELTLLNIGDSELELISPDFLDNFPKLKNLYALNTKCVGNKQMTFNPTEDWPLFEPCYRNVGGCKQVDKTCELTVANSENLRIIDCDGSGENIEEVFAVNSKIPIFPLIVLEEFVKLQILELDDVEMNELVDLDKCIELRYLSLQNNNLKVLTTNVFKKCPRLLEIKLNGNEITFIEESSISNLNYLEKLSIRNKPKSFDPENFINIRPKAFESLPSLKVLELSFYGSLNLNSNLQTLVNLKVLKIEDNSMETVKSDTFKNLANLVELSLVRNKIQKIEENSFSDLNSLESLTLSENQLTEFPDFGHPESLKHLDLSNNLLNSLEIPQTFSNLENLDLSDNKINFISLTFFEAFKSLKEMSMERNICVRKNFPNTTDFEFSAGVDLTGCRENFVRESMCIFEENSKHGYSCKMQSDHKTNKNIRMIDRQHSKDKTDRDVKYLYRKFLEISIDLSVFFGKFQNLIRVDLWKTSEKSLKIIPTCLELISFDFRLNNVGKIENNVFVKCGKLEDLILVKNDITDVHDDAFEGLLNVLRLDLSFNKISNLPANVFAKMQKMKSLNLSRNKISNLDWLRNCSEKMKILKLSYNEITSVNFDDLSRYQDLMEIHLNSNKLVRLESFGVLPKLSYVNLEQNLIVDLDLSVFKSKNLKYLDVSNNEIKSISYENDEIFRYLEQFHATGNKCIKESFIEINENRWNLMKALEKCEK